MAIVQDHAGIKEDAVDYREFVNKTSPVIVQIGSHDGILGEEYGLQEFLEEITEFHLVLVEPLQQYFNKLSEVYGKYGNLVSYCNHAITNIDGEVSMIEQGCMSFISSNGSTKVNSKKWSTFVKDMSISKINLLLLDCEGYEFELLQNIDFSKVRPEVIRYEYKYITNKEECDNFLRSHGYRIEYCKHDHTYNKLAIL